jgi:hypothetical protein
LVSDRSWCQIEVGVRVFSKWLSVSFDIVTLLVR